MFKIRKTLPNPNFFSLTQSSIAFSLKFLLVLNLLSIRCYLRQGANIKMEIFIKYPSGVEKRITGCHGEVSNFCNRTGLPFESSVRDPFFQTSGRCVFVEKVAEKVISIDSWKRVSGTVFVSLCLSLSLDPHPPAETIIKRSCRRNELCFRNIGSSENYIYIYSTESNVSKKFLTFCILLEYEILLKFKSNTCSSRYD